MRLWNERRLYSKYATPRKSDPRTAFDCNNKLFAAFFVLDGVAALELFLVSIGSRMGSSQRYSVLTFRKILKSPHHFQFQLKLKLQILP
jgi:hypothetical protein